MGSDIVSEYHDLFSNQRPILQDETCEDNSISYTLINGVFNISGSGKMECKYNSVQWNSKKASITTVIIGNTITSIINNQSPLDKMSQKLEAFQNYLQLLSVIQLKQSKQKHFFHV